MTQLEYLIALVSIIVGLGLTDLAQSLRELVRPGREVRWHWLPLTWAAIALIVIVEIWWSTFRVLQDEMFARASAFLPVLLGFLLLYLICAFALPDPEWQQGRDEDDRPTSSAPGRDTLDLKAFYFSVSHRRWFFGAFIGLLVLSQVFNIVKWALEGEAAIRTAQLVQNTVSNLAMAVLLAGLIVTERRWVHAGTAVLVVGGLLYTLVVGLPVLG